MHSQKVKKFTKSIEDLEFVRPPEGFTNQKYEPVQRQEQQ
jgi:hypothetical protein